MAKAMAAIVRRLSLKPRHCERPRQGDEVQLQARGLGLLAQRQCLGPALRAAGVDGGVVCDDAPGGAGGGGVRGIREEITRSNTTKVWIQG